MSQTRLVLLEFRLSALRQCLKRGFAAIAPDITLHFEREESGYYQDETEYESALDFPGVFQDFIAHAVLHELNSLLESALQNLAWETWVKSPEYRGPKSLDEFATSGQSDWRKFREIQGLRFHQWIELASATIGRDVNLLDGYKEVIAQREIVNALKHRQGFKDWRKSGSRKIAERHTVSRGSAARAIVDSGRFLLALHRAASAAQH